MPEPGLTESAELISIKRGIGPFNAATFVVGAIVGTGIFISPIGVLGYAGSVGAALAIWGGTGIMAAIGALCYIELGTTFPQSGSNFTYLRMCFGELPAFLYLWVFMLIIAPASKAIVALTFANYVLEPFFPHCAAPQEAIRIIAALIICLLTYINCRNVAWATRIQDVFTVAKIVALVIIILFGAYHLFKGHTENFKNAFEDTTKNPGYIVLAFYSAWYSYSGWNYLNSVTEEIKDPVRSMPRAVYIALPLVTIIYVLANVAYFAVLSSGEILTSNAVAVTFGEHTLGAMSWIMPFCVALSVFGGLNASIFSKASISFRHASGDSKTPDTIIRTSPTRNTLLPRQMMFYVGAREGHLPTFLSMINFYYFTPLPSLVFLCTLSLVYLSTSQVYDLINYTIFSDALFDTLSVSGMIWQRYKQPDLERPIKVPLVLPLIYLTLGLFLIVLPFYVDPLKAGIGIGIILTGIPVYVVTIHWENKPKFYETAVDKVTYFVQKVLLSLPEEKPDNKEPTKQK